jgi:hypothetical protein
MDVLVAVGVAVGVGIGVAGVAVGVGVISGAPMSNFVTKASGQWHVSRCTIGAGCSSRGVIGKSMDQL